MIMIPAQLVQTPADYRRMIAHLKKQKSIGVDTESNSLHAYHEKVCLIQISSPTQDFLLDPFAFEELNAMGEIFADESIQKVFHAGDYDIACLKRDYDFTFKNLFDTMLTATALGEANIGLNALVNKYLGVVLEKKYQRADWGQRPIKPEMLAYAQADSHYLLSLRDHLLKQLPPNGRLAILEEDFAALAESRLAMKGHVENIWQVKGVVGLQPKALSLLNQLNHLREELAEAADKPPFKILSDRAMIEIAQTQPKFIQELSLLPSLTPRLIRRYGKKLMAVVNAWRKNPSVVARRKLQRPTESQIKRRKALMSWRKETGLREGVPSNVILPRDLLQRLADQKITDLTHLEGEMKATPTRFKRYGSQILAQLNKENT